jgi:hypothetical protein
MRAEVRWSADMLRDLRINLISTLRRINDRGYLGVTQPRRWLDLMWARVAPERGVTLRNGNYLDA